MSPFDVHPWAFQWMGFTKGFDRGADCFSWFAWRKWGYRLSTLYCQMCHPQASHLLAIMPIAFHLTALVQSVTVEIKCIGICKFISTVRVNLFIASGNRSKHLRFKEGYLEKYFRLRNRRYFQLKITLTTSIECFFQFKCFQRWIDSGVILTFHKGNSNISRSIRYFRTDVKRNM